MEGQDASRARGNGEHVFITVVSKLHRTPGLNTRVSTGQCYFEHGNHSFVYSQNELMDTCIRFGFYVNGEIFLPTSKNKLPPTTAIINLISSYLFKDFVSAIIQSLSSQILPLQIVISFMPISIQTLSYPHPLPSVLPFLCFSLYNLPKQLSMYRLLHLPNPIPS